MKRTRFFSPATFLFMAFCFCLSHASALSVTSFSQNSSSVNRLDKYEATVLLDKTWTNPYDYTGQVEVDAFITLPGGGTVTVPGFWFQDYTRALTDTTEHLTASGTASWKIRFAPKITGSFTYYIQIIDRTTSTTIRYPATGTLSFSCVSSGNKGFLKVSTTDHAYLQYEDGSQYVGIGHNLCGWEYAGTANTRGTYDYDSWLTSMSTNKANLSQFDFCEGDQIEWTYNASELPYSASWSGIGTYNQQTAWKMDYKMTKASTLGIFYRIALSHWEDFDGETGNFPGWGWNRNPYNSANGGPVADVGGFFTDTTAKNYYKRFLRYIAARWGYSKNLLTWELWNEVDGSMVWGSGSYASNQTNIANWHSEMATFLKTLDPNHLITTSFADSRNQSSVWALTNLDLTTAHRYTYYNVGYGEQQYETENCVGNLVQNRFVNYPKPVLIGEFALSPAGDIQRNNDPTGIAFHNQLWASIMQRGATTAMHWTWGSYIDADNLYFHYKPLGIFLTGEDLSNMQMYKTYNATARCYGLKTWSKAYIWMQNIHHTYIDRAMTNGTVSGQTVNLSKMDSGTYVVKFYNTYTGDSSTSGTLYTTTGGILNIPVPNFTSDIAMKVVKTSGVTGNTNYAGDPGFEGETANQTPSAWSTWPGAAGTDWGADYSEALTPHTGTNRGTHYKSSAYEVYTYQIITGIPNGTYQYKAWVISSGGQAATFIEAKDYGSPTLLQTSIPTTSTWTHISVNNIPVTNGQCTIGIYSKGNSGNWLGFDDIEFIQHSGTDLGAKTTAASGMLTEERPTDKVVLYPNPVQSVLTIANITQPAIAEIYSTAGVRLISQRISAGSINVGSLTPGTYILRVNGKSFPFIKQ